MDSNVLQTALEGGEHMLSGNKEEKLPGEEPRTTDTSWAKQQP